jgi:O-phospho-L-seryl-tRNASec:L-selenocysteinyl-tRNA synthase
MPDNLIEHLLYELSLMDTNNFSQRAGVGEREGRIFSPIVQKRNFYMSHGIGRSGDLFSVQPKAAGSSLILKLTNALAKHALKLSNLPKLHCVVVPLATGMSLTLAMLTLKTTRVVREI